MHHVGLVVAHASVLTDGLREHASVVFPAESHAEKEGTVVHPDGRLQRLRAAIGHPGDIRPGWWVLTELSKRVGLDTGVLTSGMAFKQLVEAVPFYAGLTLDELGGRGVRWPQRPEAESLGERPAGSAPPPSPVPPEAEAADAGAFADEPTIGEPAESTVPTPRDDAPEIGATDGGGGGRGDGALRLGTYRPFWASPEVEISPSLHFTIARQQLELSPEDAGRLGIAGGETVEVSQNGARVEAKAVVRSGVPAGIAFLAEGIAADSANALTGAEIEVRKP
jgi:NADH-quinone oxidoreductase subunit G